MFSHFLNLLSLKKKSDNGIHNQIPRVLAKTHVVEMLIKIWLIINLSHKCDMAVN